MSDIALTIRPADLLALLLTRTPPVKETPMAQAQVPVREFSEYVLAAAAAQGVAVPPRGRPVHKVNSPRPPQRDRSKRGRPQDESPPSNTGWA